MGRFEKTLERFLTSDDYREALIAHANHSRAWLYTHQTLKVRLFPAGTWEVDPPSSRSNGKDCIVTLSQISYYREKMEEVGEQRDFEDILHADPEGARKVIEKLYEKQEINVKQDTRDQFKYMQARGSMD